MAPRSTSMILDCSSFDNAMTSVASIFGKSKSALTATLESTTDLTEEELHKFIDQELGKPRSDYEVVWFHGSRAENASCFKTNGILTTSEAKKYLEPLLRDLAKDLTKVGEGPYAGCLATKVMLNDDGPFAFLIRDAVVTSHFLEAPEFVSDFASDLLGKNYKLLVNRFKEITHPYIVRFVERPEGHELHNALYFLHLVVTGESIADAVSRANTCFNARGNAIPFARIQNVELVKNGA